MAHNLILLTIDCLRYDRLNHKTTPNLDKLSNSGAFFSKAMATAPWTPASMKSIFTSKYPLDNDGKLAIDSKTVSFVEILKDNGYSTVGFHSNPWLTRLFGYHRGFDYFFDGTNCKNTKFFHASLLGIFRKLNDDNIFKKKIRKIYSILPKIKVSSIEAETINKKALDWLSSKSNDSNFFLWIHYMGAHEPYEPSKKNSPKISRKKAHSLNSKIGSNQKMTVKELDCLIDLYDSQVQLIDEAIWSFYEKLKESNYLDDTYIVITADHGQQFLEHNELGHGLHLYDELIHVPLIILGPGIGNIHIENEVSLIDIAPTIVDILGIDATDDFNGVSLEPLIHNKESETSLVFSEEGRTKRSSPNLTAKLDFGNKKISIVTTDWKYIYNETTQHELYNLKTDKYEKNNLIDLEKEIANKLLTEILKHINNLNTSSKVKSEKHKISKRIEKLKTIDII